MQRNSEFVGMSTDQKQLEGAAEWTLEETARRMREGVEVRDRTYHLKRYKQCFLGRDAVKWLIEAGVAGDEKHAEAVGSIMIEQGFFRHVTNDHMLKNRKLYYRFAADERDRGHTATKSDGETHSWKDLFDDGWAQTAKDDDENESSKLGPSVSQSKGGVQTEGNAPTCTGSTEELPLSAEHLQVSPLDEHNTRLLDNVHPVKWHNPQPVNEDSRDQYNLVVIGAGAGGLVTAIGTARLGGKVAIVEEHLMGGDCLNVGCVPSKALLGAAERVRQVKSADELGVEVTGVVRVAFDRIMERLRKIRADISKWDSAQRFTENGVDVFLGRAKFLDAHHIEISSSSGANNDKEVEAEEGSDRKDTNGSDQNKKTTLKFAKCVIATGAKARVPAIPGIENVKYTTHMTVFNMTALPRRIGVIGGGPIGCELAQAFARFGAEVTVFLRSSRILPKEEWKAAQIVQKSMERDGVRFQFGSKYLAVGHAPDGKDASETGTGSQMDGKVRYEVSPVCDAGDQTIWLDVEVPEGSATAHNAVAGVTFKDLAKPSGESKRTVRSVPMDALVLAIGKAPNVLGLNLEAAGVAYEARSGITVNDNLRSTSASHIYAVGDCCSRYQFTHMADSMARMVIRNMFFFGRGKVSSLLIPWATYTDPEVAHVSIGNGGGISFDKSFRRLPESESADVSEKKVTKVGQVAVPGKEEPKGSDEFAVYERTFEDLDRALCEGDNEGYIRIYTKKSNDEIVGATIVGPHAGDMISELTLAIQGEIGLSKLGSVIHPYPTRAECIRQMGDKYNGTRLTPFVKKLLRGILNKRR